MCDKQACLKQLARLVFSPGATSMACVVRQLEQQNSGRGWTFAHCFPHSGVHGIHVDCTPSANCARVDDH